MRLVLVLNMLSSLNKDIIIIIIIIIKHQPSSNRPFYPSTTSRRCYSPGPDHSALICPKAGKQRSRKIQNMK